MSKVTVSPEMVRGAYAKHPNHRAVAAMMQLPLHYVMFVCGLMSERLYHAING